MSLTAVLNAAVPDTPVPDTAVPDTAVPDTAPGPACARICGQGVCFGRGSEEAT